MDAKRDAKRDAMNKPKRTRSSSAPATSAWSAPVPPWVLTHACDRSGKALSAAALVLLVYLWMRADAPSKRKPGATFLRPCWRLSIADLATALRRDTSSIDRQFSALVRAGFVRRGEHLVDGVVEIGIWLADLDVGLFDTAKTRDGETITSRENAVPTTAKTRSQPPRKRGPNHRENAVRIKEARSIPDQFPIIPDQFMREDVGRSVEVQPESPRGQRGQTLMQQALFGEQPPPSAPVRDPVQEVFDYLAERIYVTRIDMGLPAIGMSVIPKEGRSLIKARLEEHGYKRDAKGKPTGEYDIELGVETCKQVIDVDEADARRTKTFDYWNAITPFRPANFVGRLARWRPEGKHVAFGVVRTRGASADAGFNAYMPDAEREELLRKVSRGGSYGEDGHGGDAPAPRPEAPADDGDPWDPRKLGFAE